MSPDLPKCRACRLILTFTVSFGDYWEIPNCGFNYTFTPIRKFTSNGLKCRNYSLLIRGSGIDQSSMLVEMMALKNLEIIPPKHQARRLLIVDKY